MTKNKTRSRDQRVKKETTRHARAFTYYAGFPSEKRSLRKVAEEFKVRLTTVHRWSVSFNWKEKIEKMEKKAIEKIEQKFEEDFFVNKTRIRKMKLRLFAILEKHTNNKNLDPSDVDRILKLVKTELGEPTSITQGKYEVEDVNPLTGIFGEIFGEKYEDDKRTKSEKKAKETKSTK